MPLAVTGISPTTAVDSGGDLLVAAGTFVTTHPVTVEVKVGANPDVWTPCYTPVSVPVVTTEFPFVMPPLPRGGQYGFRFTQNGEEAQVNAAVYVANRQFSSSTLALKKAMPLYSVGPGRLEDTDPLPTVDVDPPKLSITWPATPFFLVDADLPGAGNEPKELAQDLGTFTASNGPIPFTASPGSTPGYWLYNGVNQEHNLTVAGVDGTPPYTVVGLIFHENPVVTQFIGDYFAGVGGVPHLRTLATVGTTDFRVSNLANIDTNMAWGQWLCQIVWINGSQDLTNHELRSGVSATVLSTAIDRLDLSGGDVDLGNNAGNFFEGRIAAVCGMPGNVPYASIKTAINDRFTGLFP
jgi:hypothetical protein